MSACVKVGDLFSNATNFFPSVAPDYQQAIKYYNIACDAGEMYICMKLGIRFEEGQGVTRDYNQARRYFTKACDGKLQDACVNLSAMRSLSFH
jgi:TPR repeat protein